MVLVRQKDRQKPIQLNRKATGGRSAPLMPGRRDSFHAGGRTHLLKKASMKIPSLPTRSWSASLKSSLGGNSSSWRDGERICSRLSPWRSLGRKRGRGSYLWRHLHRGGGHGGGFGLLRLVIRGQRGGDAVGWRHWEVPLETVLCVNGRKLQFEWKGKSFQPRSDAGGRE